PDICSKGSAVQSTMPGNIYGSMTGTSMASPGVAGCVAQLIDAYRSLNGGNDPTLAELKCVMLNTAEDLGNVGPDFTYGWGRINVWKTYNALKDKRTLSATIANGATNTHPIVVPANVTELRVMLYWADPAASAGVSKALINDLDITLTASSQTYNPWKLNSASPGTAATKGADRDNNMEQVVVDNPTAGTYTLNVNGYQIPQGPQEYWVSYEFITDDIKVTYPIGGESFVPGETEYIRWDAPEGTGTFTIEYSTNGGTSWTNITTTASATARFYSWTVPSTLSGETRIRVSRSGKSGTSDANFNIINVPGSLKIDWRCAPNYQLSWSAVSGATEYEVYLLGQKYMESQGKTANTNFIVNAPNTTVQWTSVRALAANGQVIGRRAVAISVGTNIVSCTNTAISESSDIAYSFSVFPNPIKESASLSINLSQADNLNIRLIDICGKEIAVVARDQELPAGEHIFKFGNIDVPGLYLVSVEGSKGAMYQKVVIVED
ncbi:MAG TPA: S8 family serine peptidase, partial [Bacteroidia bacterium]|nr:S8 family serine peptidase [Bacteroidia bacterium]